MWDYLPPWEAWNARGEGPRQYRAHATTDKAGCFLWPFCHRNLRCSPSVEAAGPGHLSHEGTVRSGPALGNIQVPIPRVPARFQNSVVRPGSILSPRPGCSPASLLNHKCLAQWTTAVAGRVEGSTSPGSDFSGACLQGALWKPVGSSWRHPADLSILPQMPAWALECVGLVSTTHPGPFSCSLCPQRTLSLSVDVGIFDCSRGLSLTL